jgi:hypothetical protein
LADFALTRLLLYRVYQINSRNGWGDCWHIAAITARFAKGPDMPQLADFGRFLYDQTQPSQRGMFTVAETLRKFQHLAKCAGSGEPVFTLMDALLYGP